MIFTKKLKINSITQGLIFIFPGCLISGLAHSQGYDASVPPSSYSSPISWNDLENVSTASQPNTFRVPKPASAGKYVYVQLDSGKNYSGRQILIDHSNVVFDCNNASLSGGGGQLSAGITIQAPDNKEIKNITIKNCKVSGFKDYGAVVYNSFNEGVAIDPTLSQSAISQINQATIANTGCASKANPTRLYVRECVRAVSPDNIVIDNSYFSDNGHGINIKQYVKGAVIKNSTISDNVIGIHISYSSANTQVLNSVFSKNGDRDKGSDREAIAIDSSINNYISGNSFIDNVESAIRTYKNCGEAIKKVNKDGSVEYRTGNTREDYASNNTIINNSFVLSDAYAARDNAKPNATFDDKGFFRAISIADRQSTAAGQWQCSGGYYFSKGAQVARDYSQNNTIKNNTFKNYRMPIRVMDDNNVVEGNTFLASKALNVIPEIHVGSNIRSLANIPVTGNVIKGNNTEGSTVKTVLYGTGTKATVNGKCALANKDGCH